LIALALSAAAGVIETKRRNKHVEAAMAGFSDVGSIPTVSTFHVPQSRLSDIFFGRRVFFCSAMRREKCELPSKNQTPSPFLSQPLNFILFNSFKLKYKYVL